VSVPLDILTVLKPNFPPSGQVLGHGTPINEDRWNGVATQTDEAEVAWVISNLSRPITRSNVIGLRDPNPVTRRRGVAILLQVGQGLAGVISRSRICEWLNLA
jgi:hypothetical protein